MRYQQLIDLGFKRQEAEDNVFFNQYGFDYFWLTRKLGRRHELNWCPIESDTVELNKYEKNGYSIEKQWLITDFQTVKKIVELFG